MYILSRDMSLELQYPLHLTCCLGVSNSHILNWLLHICNHLPSDNKLPSVSVWKQISCFQEANTKRKECDLSNHTEIRVSHAVQVQEWYWKVLLCEHSHFLWNLCCMLVCIPVSCWYAPSYASKCAYPLRQTDRQTSCPLKVPALYAVNLIHL